MRITKFYCPECDTVFGPPGTLPRDLPIAARDYTCTDCGAQLEVYEHSLRHTVWGHPVYDPDEARPLYPVLYWQNPGKPRKP
jgi:predicted RNA-binding Zn-ribbon protein involved in translation (DUF1610 family)